MNICMVLGCHFNYNKGGAEIQADLLANYMIEKGHQINYIRKGGKNSKKPRKYKKNYWIYQVKKPLLNKNIFSYKNRGFLYKLLNKIDPDVIYQRGIHFADMISYYGNKNDIPVVSGISQDDMCSRNNLTLNPKGFLNLINNLIKEKYHQKSKMIISQTERQKKLLKKNFSVNSVVIPNGHEVPSKKRIKKTKPPIVCWIGNMKKWKQPEIFLKLAKELDYINARFVYCGRLPSNNVYKNKIIRKTKDLPNVDYLGEVPFDKTNELLLKSSIFVNTSASLSNSKYERTEGFPNTFIQAWMRKTPVISLNFDPDGIVKKFRLGRISGDFNTLKNDVKELIKNEKLRRRIGEKARDHAVEKFDMKKIGKRHLQIFKTLLNN